mgnify:CR=1 FL=1
MTLEEAKFYKEKFYKDRDRNSSYLDKYLNFIYDVIRSCIDNNKGSWSVKFTIYQIRDNNLSDTILIAGEGNVYDSCINRYTVADIAKELNSNGYNINVTLFRADDSYNIDLDEFIRCFETLDIKDKFFADTLIYELEVSGW